MLKNLYLESACWDLKTFKSNAKLKSINTERSALFWLYAQLQFCDQMLLVFEWILPLRGCSGSRLSVTLTHISVGRNRRARTHHQAWTCTRSKSHMQLKTQKLKHTHSTQSQPIVACTHTQACWFLPCVGCWRKMCLTRTRCQIQTRLKNKWWSKWSTNASHQTLNNHTHTHSFSPSQSCYL